MLNMTRGRITSSFSKQLGRRFRYPRAIIESCNALVADKDHERILAIVSGNHKRGTTEGGTYFTPSQFEVILYK